MTKFIVVFLPNIIRDGNVGDVISLLESLKLRVIEAYKFQMDDVCFVKTDEYLRILHHIERIYSPGLQAKKIDELKKQVVNGNLFSLRFESPIITSIEDLIFMMRSQTRINPYYLMLFEEMDWIVRFKKASELTEAFFYYVDALLFVDCSINEFNFLTRRLGAGIYDNLRFLSCSVFKSQSV